MADTLSHAGRGDALFSSITPDGLRHKRFATIRNGFDPEEVGDFLCRLAEQQEASAAQIQRLQVFLDAGVERPGGDRAEAEEKAYRMLSERMADVIRAADEHAERIRREAETEAARTLAEAAAGAAEEADRLRHEAVMEAERTVQDARSRSDKLLEEAEGIAETLAEADQVLGALSVRRADLLEELREIQGRLAGLAERLGQDIVTLEENPDLVVLPTVSPPLAGAETGA